MTVADRKPDFIGIGAAKCGTTWLTLALDRHPDIQVAAEKEIVFFSGKRYAFGIDWYLEKFEKLDPNKCIGEFSVAYMTNAKVVAPRIAAFHPDVKLLAVLRHPLKRARSHLNFTRQIKKMDLTNKDPIELDNSVIVNSLYYDNLQPFFDEFPNSQILIVKFEDMISNPEMEFGRIFDFLGVSASSFAARTLVREGQTISPRWRFLEDIRQKTFQHLRSAGRDEYIRLFKRLGLSRLYRRINDNGQRLNFTGEQKQRLRELLVPQIEKLVPLVDFDTSDWLTGYD